jgi:hypothetical protein
VAKAKTVGPVGAIIIGIIMVIGGYLLAFHVGRPAMQKAEASEGWPTVTGVVTHSEVARDHDPDGTMYSPDVEYEYTVDGEDYVGNTITVGAKVSTNVASGAQKKVNEYPEGREVEVHYDPDEPAESCLEPGVKASASIPFWAGIGILVLGVVLAVVTPVKRILGRG